MRNLPRRRARLEIYASIVQTASTETVSLYRILVRTNLNGRLAKEAVEQLVASGFLTTGGNDEHRMYSSTPKGLDWLSRYGSLIEELRYRKS